MPNSTSQHKTSPYGKFMRCTGVYKKTQRNKNGAFIIRVIDPCMSHDFPVECCLVALCCVMCGWPKDGFKKFSRRWRGKNPHIFPHHKKQQ